MSLFSRLFARTPAQQESAYHPVYAAVVARLEREGVRVGKGAGYPRIEVHTITEGERLDKEGMLRQFSLTVESIGNASLAATAAMNEKNVELLTSELTLPEGWNCLGVLPDQLQDLTESADSAKIIYRLLQGFTIYVERVKEEEEPEEPADPTDPTDPTDPGEDENQGTGSTDTPLGPAHEGSGSTSETPGVLNPGAGTGSGDTHRH